MSGAYPDRALHGPDGRIIYSDGDAAEQETTMATMATTPTPPPVGPAPSTPVSPKVVLATLLGGVLVPALLAVGTYVLANQDVLGIENPVLGTFVFALITGAVTFLAGWLPRDGLRELGAKANGDLDPPTI